MSGPDGPPPIVLVDDDEDAHTLIRAALERGKVTHPVLSFLSGAAAMEFLDSLRSPDDPSRDARVCFVLLDVRMPGMSGLDLLAWIRNQSHLGSLNVVMLSTTDEAEDVARAKELGAPTYLLKYPGHETLAAIAKYSALARTF